LEFQGIEKRFEGTTKIIKSRYINRINKDITKVEIYIDTSLIVRKLHLYARELPPVHLLADRIYKAYPDASCEINSDLIIHEKECTLVLSQYEEI
jgi:hypothetical protein